MVIFLDFASFSSDFATVVHDSSCIIENFRQL